MAIIEYLGDSIKEYVQIYLPLFHRGDGQWVPRTCSSCDEEDMHRHEYKVRQVAPQDGSGDENIEVLRMRCRWCESTHTLLPHFAVPYHTYAAQTILEALRLYAKHGSYHLVKRMIETVRSRAVVRQWVQQFSKVMDALIRELERFLGEFGQDVPSRCKRRTRPKSPWLSQSTLWVSPHGR